MRGLLAALAAIALVQVPQAGAQGSAESVRVPVRMPAAATATAAVRPAGLDGGSPGKAGNASPIAEMRASNHAGYGRMLFDMPPGTSARVEQTVDELTVQFTGAEIRLGLLRPRNVRSVEVSGSNVVAALVPGAGIRTTRLPRFLIIDIIDPSPAFSQPTPSPAPAIVANRQAAHSEVAGAAVRLAASTPVPPPKAQAAPSPTPVKLEDPRREPPLDEAANPAQPPVAEPARHPAPKSDARRSSDGERAAGSSVGPNEAEPAETPNPARPSADTMPPASQPRAEFGRRPDATAADGERALRLVARPVANGGLPVEAITLPFTKGVGAASFRIGGDAVAVFDERRPIDLSLLRDDRNFGGATIQMLPGATILRMPLADGSALRLSRRAETWVLRIRPETEDAPAPVGQTIEKGVLQLGAANPGSVVSMQDWRNGGPLLVGTEVAAGQAVTLAMRTPFFALRTTWQGVVVEPLTDALTVRSRADGFAVAAAADALPLAEPLSEIAALRDAAVFSRSFDIPSLSNASLLRRADEARRAAADAPAQSRFTPRLDLAQALLALGLGNEAQSVIAAAADDAPQSAGDSRLVMLAAAAAVIAGRPLEAAHLDDAALPASDELGLWRALRQAIADPRSQAAEPALAAQLALLRAYPEPLRKRLLPIALQTIASGSHAGAVTRLLGETQADPHLEFARATALETLGVAGSDSGAAAGAYQALAVGEDRWVRSQSLRRLTELRLKNGTISPAQAADEVERHLDSWRDEEWEIAQRIRAAGLRRDAGQWRRAVSLLRETLKTWPEQREHVEPDLTALLEDAVGETGRATMSPLDLVTFAEENADLLPSGDAGRPLAIRIAEEMVSLELPVRATAVLTKLLASASDSLAKAEVADRLAVLQLRQHDSAAALRTLAATDAGDLPAELRERRALTEARARADTGEIGKATALLAQIGTPRAEELRANLLEKAKDWPAALAVIKAYANKIVPDTGPLDERQARALLRVATIAAEAGDEATLAQVRTRDTPRLPLGEVTDMIASLTRGRLDGVGDLQEVSREIALAKQLPGHLRNLAAAADAPVTR